MCASLYRGGPSITDDALEVFATHEARLERDGQREVQVVIARRTRERGKSEYEDDLLKLTIEDARELAAVLTGWSRWLRTARHSG